MRSKLIVSRLLQLLLLVMAWCWAPIVSSNQIIIPTASGFEAGAGFPAASLSVFITTLVVTVLIGWMVWAFIGLSIEAFLKGSYGVWIVLFALLILVFSLVMAVLFA